MKFPPFHLSFIPVNSYLYFMHSHSDSKESHVTYFLIIQVVGWNGDYNDVEHPMFDRGYTTHEHLPHFGLINMNGRVYDPLTAQFLSPDNYVQAPDITQNFNRYAYAMNNPLVYTDPSGEFWHIIIGAIVGSVVGNVQGIIEANQQGMKGWDAFKHVMVKAHIGGAAGAMGAFTGGAIGGGLGGAALGGATSGSINATATTAYNGGSMSDILAANFWGSNIGGLSGAAGYGITSSLGLKLFDAPNHIKEPLYASINRNIRLDLEPAMNMLSSTGGMSTGGLSSMMINLDIWQGFPQKDFSLLNPSQRAEHLLHAIRYTNHYGDGFVNVDKIFKKFSYMSIAGIGRGFESGLVDVNIGGENFKVNINFSLYRNPYDPNVNFGGGFTEPRNIYLNSNTIIEMSAIKNAHSQIIVEKDYYYFLMKWIGYKK